MSGHTLMVRVASVGAWLRAMFCGGGDEHENDRRATEWRAACERAARDHQPPPYPPNRVYTR